MRRLLPPPEPEDVYLVMGKRGSGKSTYVKDCIESWGRLPTVAWDFHDEYSAHGRSSPRVRLGPLRDRISYEELLDRDGVLEADDLSLAVVPDRDPDAVPRDFDALSELVLNVGGIIYVVDEVALTGQDCERTWKFLATQGRHSGVPLVAVAQWATAIPKSVRRQATAIVAFRQDEVSDLRALEERIGPQRASVVSELGRGECVVWLESDEWGEGPSKEQKNEGLPPDRRNRDRLDCRDQKVRAEGRIHDRSL